MKFESTPNPNAIKCVLPEARTGPIVSAGSPEQAGGDGQALALLAIPGVTRVLLHTSFVSVSKDPDASWTSIKRAVKQVLADG